MTVICIDPPKGVLPESDVIGGGGGSIFNYKKQGEYDENEDDNMGTTVR